MNRIIALLLCLAGTAFANPPVLTPKIAPPSTPPIISDQQLQQWSALLTNLPTRTPKTLLWVKRADYPYSFPPQKGDKTLFREPATAVEFGVRLQDLPFVPIRLVLQLATEPSSLHLTPPYAGWDKPKGLVHSQTFTPPIRSQPADSQSSSTEEIMPLIPAALPGGAIGSVSVNATARYAYFTLPLPLPAHASAGTVFYARVVPVVERDGQTRPVGPASNWIRFYVGNSKAEVEQKAADQKLAAAKAKAEAEGKQLVTKVNEAVAALPAAYEIRLLSYIPPKFSDDKDAPVYFVCRQGTSISFDKGKKATNISRGETYSTTYVRNLLNSNRTWNQDLWDTLSASLQQNSAAFTQAKLFVVNSVADGLEATTGQKISPAMRAAMLQGLDIALAYCGIPPSLPNIDELYDRGLSYMAATIVDVAIEQTTGVAISDLGANPLATIAVAEAARGPAEEGVKKMLKQLTQPAPFDQQVPETWGTPAPYFRRRPPMLYLEIRRTAAKEPVGQTWQSLRLSFNNTFLELPAVLLPRTPGQRLIVPVALAPQNPAQWKQVGVMPDPNADASLGFGQPYYASMTMCQVGIQTRHRLLATDTEFTCDWPGFAVQPALINARAYPDKLVLTPAEILAAQNGPVVLGPANYYGKIRLRWFRAE